MAIVINCPACGVRLTLGDDRAGAVLDCPKCDAKVSVPRPADRFAMTPVDEPAEAATPAVRALPAWPAIDYPVAFVWWQRRFHGRTFPFDCPGCGTTIDLRQRVTQAKRKCPGCGYQITIEAIDRQLKGWEPERQRIMNRWGCLPAVALVAAAIAFRAYWI